MDLCACSTSFGIRDMGQSSIREQCIGHLDFSVGSVSSKARLLALLVTADKMAMRNVCCNWSRETHRHADPHKAQPSAFNSTRLRACITYGTCQPDVSGLPRN